MVNLNYNSKKRIVITICLFIILFTINKFTILTDSQLEYFPGYIGMGAIVPPLDNQYLSISNASISVITEVKDERNYTLPITYDCNYSIYNPSSLINTKIAIPFSVDLLYSLDVNTTVWFNGTEVETQECDRDLENEIEDLYDGYYFEFLCVDNLEFPSNSSSQIRIMIESAVYVTRGRSSPQLWIFYDVRTSNLWKGNINQTIEYLIYGEQPFEYSNYSTTTPQRICEVAHFNDRSSYVWKWENERIIEESVTVKFRIPRDKPFTLLVESNLVFVMVTIIVSSSFMYVNKYRKNRKEVC